MSLDITFTGLEARRHHIEAREGLESLAGMAHAATLVAHFVATGKVRQRQPYDDGLIFFFQDVRPGSLTAVLAIGGSLAAGVAGNFLTDVVKAVFKRATGTGDANDLQIGDHVFQSGDLDALAEAVTPSLLRGHSWIGHPDQRISLKRGRDVLVDFNEATRDYMKDEVIEEGDSLQDISVAALNVNSRHGRVYFFDLGRTVSFKVDRNASARTIPTLARYLTRYAERTNAAVNIRFKKVFYTDGRLKRIMISDCYSIADVE